MNEKTLNLVAVLPDGKEFCKEVTVTRFNQPAKEIAEQALYEHKITTSRKDPQAMTVQVYRFAIQNGKMNRVKYADVFVTPSLAPMTKEEYEEELADIVCNSLPPAFQLFVQSQAWERGHHGGYEEVIGIASDLTDSLETALKEFKTTLTKKLDDGLSEIVQREGYQEMADGFSRACQIVKEEL